MQFNGRDVVYAEIDGVDSKDYPDFSDAYFSYAEFEDGTPLTESQLDWLTNEYGDVVNEMAHDNFVTAADYLYDRNRDR